MEYLSTREIMIKFGWTTRATVSQKALRWKWNRKNGHRPHSYLREDVERYALNREHTFEAKRRGLWHHNGLIEHGNGTECPICKETKDDAI